MKSVLLLSLILASTHLAHADGGWIEAAPAEVSVDAASDAFLDIESEEAEGYASGRGGFSGPVRASYYGKGDGFAGKKTACGNRMNPNAMTFANRSMKCGQIVCFKYGNVMRQAKRDDAGPYARGRVFDVSYGLYRALGYATDKPLYYKLGPCDAGDDEKKIVTEPMIAKPEGSKKPAEEKKVEPKKPDGEIKQPELKKPDAPLDAPPTSDSRLRIVPGAPIREIKP
jgi:rare lipoprotein A (peptidoglycan hydrolase)